MTLTVHDKNLQTALRHYHFRFSLDLIRDIFNRNGKNMKKLYRALDRMSENQDKARPESSKKHPTFEQKKEMLWTEISKLYKKKEGMKEGPEKRELRALIDRTVINWNRENHPFGFFDLHWMTPNGAADFVVKTVNDVLDGSACSGKENNSEDRKELKFVVGIGKHSQSEVAATLRKEVFSRLSNHPRCHLFDWRTPPENRGLVEIRLK